MQRIVGNFMGGMEYTEKERNKIATAILQCVTKSYGFCYFVKLLVMHILPVVYTGFIVYQMCAFVEIQYQSNLLSQAGDLLSQHFSTSRDVRSDTYVYTRNDSLLNVFPRNPMYQTNCPDSTGTDTTIKIKCIQFAANYMELVYLLQLFLLIVCFYIMIVDFALLALKLLLAACFSHSKIFKLSFGAHVLLLLIRKNVDPLLFREIHERTYNYLPEHSKYDYDSKYSV